MAGAAKLVRGRIPELAAGAGQAAVFRQANPGRVRAAAPRQAAGGSPRGSHGGPG